MNLINAMTFRLKHIILTVASTLLLLAVTSCYDLGGMGRNPYELDDPKGGSGDTPSKADSTRYSDIDINYTVSAQDSAKLKTVLADAASLFRTFLYEGYYNDYQITTNLSHDIYAGYVANNQPNHSMKTPDYGYSDGWSGTRWKWFYTRR